MAHSADRNAFLRQRVGRRGLWRHVTRVANPCNQALASTQWPKKKSRLTEYGIHHTAEDSAPCVN